MLPGFSYHYTGKQWIFHLNQLLNYVMQHYENTFQRHKFIFLAKEWWHIATQTQMVRFTKRNSVMQSFVYIFLTVFSSSIGIRFVTETIKHHHRSLNIVKSRQMERGNFIGLKTSIQL